MSIDQAHAERSIKLAAKLYETRSFMREHYPEPIYSKHISDCRQLIKDRIAAAPGASPLDAALQVALLSKEIGEDANIGWLVAAALDMIEECES